MTTYTFNGWVEVGFYDWETDEFAVVEMYSDTINYVTDVSGTSVTYTVEGLYTEEDTGFSGADILLSGIGELLYASDSTGGASVLDADYVSMETFTVEWGDPSQRHFCLHSWSGRTRMQAAGTVLA